MKWITIHIYVIALYILSWSVRYNAGMRSGGKWCDFGWDWNFIDSDQEARERENENDNVFLTKMRFRGFFLNSLKQSLRLEFCFQAKTLQGSSTYVSTSIFPSVRITATMAVDGTHSSLHCSNILIANASSIPRFTQKFLSLDQYLIQRLN